jgi:hypothetical protein
MTDDATAQRQARRRTTAEMNNNGKYTDRQLFSLQWRSWRRWREKEHVQNFCYGMSNLEGTYLQRVLETGV